MLNERPGSEVIAGVLREHPSPASLSSRWVALLTPDARPIKARVEDVGQSLAIAVTLRARSRQ